METRNKHAMKHNHCPKGKEKEKGENVTDN